MRGKPLVLHLPSLSQAATTDLSLQGPFLPHSQGHTYSLDTIPAPPWCRGPGLPSWGVFPGRRLLHRSLGGLGTQPVQRCITDVSQAPGICHSSHLMPMLLILRVLGLWGTAPMSSPLAPRSLSSKPERKRALPGSSAAPLRLHQALSVTSSAGP